MRVAILFGLAVLSLSMAVLGAPPVTTSMASDTDLVIRGHYTEMPVLTLDVPIGVFIASMAADIRELRAEVASLRAEVVSLRVPRWTGPLPGPGWWDPCATIPCNGGQP